MAFMLVVLSVALFFGHYLIFKDSHHIFIYMLGDIAFLPIEIVFVSLIFHKIIEDKEKKKTHRKLNMLIGVFYSDTGNALLKMLTDSDINITNMKNKLLIKSSWTKKNFKTAGRSIDQYKADLELLNLKALKTFLSKKRDFMLKIIENPSLLEHELFSELMMSLFHLQEELSNRHDVGALVKNDSDHLKNDVSRVYSMLLKDWLLYTQHLKNEYPYLFSFAIRTNPFDENAKVEIS